MVTSSDVSYQMGDTIDNKYLIIDIFEGGFGIVYLVKDIQLNDIFVFKTFRDDLFIIPEVWERFFREAKIWIDIGRHPHLVRAIFVSKIDERPYIAMEYIPPNEDDINSLRGYLEKNPPDLHQSLQWSIQLCYGMSHAYQNGLKCHRDIKPDNLMITRDNILKITDFGIANIFGDSQILNSPNIAYQSVAHTFKTSSTKPYGCAPYMSPEHFINFSDCDERSDIYSFGIVLYQMASKGILPFDIKPMENESTSEYEYYMSEMKRLHCNVPIPIIDSPLNAIIQRCCVKNKNNRYQSFNELRGDLEQLLFSIFNEHVPKPNKINLEILEFGNIGASLLNLGYTKESIPYFKKVLEKMPGEVKMLNNMGIAYLELDEKDKAIKYFKKAIEKDSTNIEAYNNIGTLYMRKQRYNKALKYFNEILKRDKNYKNAIFNKATCLTKLNRHKEAIECYSRVIQIDSRLFLAWYNKAASEELLGMNEEAINSLKRVIGLTPPSDSKSIEYAKNRIRLIEES